MSAQSTALPLWSQLEQARVIDLAHPYEIGMPQSPNHPPFRLVMERRHGDLVRSDGGSAANELLILGGHVGTHVDALGHVSQAGQVYGGIGAGDLVTNRGLRQLGIEEFAPFAGRGVLLDVAGLHDVSVLPPGYEVTVNDLLEAQDRAGVELRPGDAVLIGTGWSQHWGDRATFVGNELGVPGLGPASARWLAERRPRLVGGETIAFECLPPGAGHSLLPVHRIMLVEAGINIIETLNLTELRACQVAEFALILAPLPIVGATGAPTRPLAILPRTTEVPHG